MILSTSGTLAPTYDDLEETIEKIVSMKVARWTFPGHDSDDIAQEVRVFCWQALKKYDFAKEGKGVFYFLTKCVDNGLYNKGRGVYFDNNPPCKRCPDYDPQRPRECCGSQRMIDYQNRMAQKRAIDNPCSLFSMPDNQNGATEAFEYRTSVGSLTGMVNLDLEIRANLDEDLIPFYEAMLNGDYTDVPISIKRQIREAVKEIITNEED
jgi:hypothetical protein